MPIITPKESDNLQDIVLDYLQGEAIDVVKVCLQTQSSELKADCKALYKSINLNSLEQDVGLRAILASVNIQYDTPIYHKLLAKSKTLYDLLTHLYHNGNRHVGGLLRLIENTKRPRNWTLLFLSGTLLSAGVGFLFYFKKEYVEAAIEWFNAAFPSALKWLERTFALLRNFALMGIITNTLSLAAAWYHTFTNGTTSAAHKLDKLFFRTLTGVCTISAYVLSYFLEGAMAAPAAILFVIGSSIDFFKSLYTLYHSHRALKTLSVPGKDSAWEVIAEYERAKNNHERLAHSVWIKLVAAVLTTIAVAVWSFFPPSLVLTICCFSFITLIGLTKKSVLASVDDSYAQNLQTAIKKIEAPINIAQQSSVNRLHNQQQILKEKEKELDAREKDLDAREHALQVRTQGVDEALSAVARGLSSPARALKVLRGSGASVQAAQHSSPPLALDKENQAAASYPLFAPANEEQANVNSAFHPSP